MPFTVPVDEQTQGEDETEGETDGLSFSFGNSAALRSSEHLLDFRHLLISFLPRLFVFLRCYSATSGAQHCLSWFVSWDISGDISFIGKTQLSEFFFFVIFTQLFVIFVFFKLRFYSHSCAVFVPDVKKGNGKCWQRSNKRLLVFLKYNTTNICPGHETCPFESGFTNCEENLTEASVLCLNLTKKVNFFFLQHQHTVGNPRGTEHRQRQRVWGSVLQGHTADQEETPGWHIWEESQNQKGKLSGST